MPSSSITLFPAELLAYCGAVSFFIAIVMAALLVIFVFHSRYEIVERPSTDKEKRYDH